MIDHAEVRERLELAAVEPGGIDRLAAGDTVDSAAIAGHLAGCAACAEEARRLAHAAPIIAEVARGVPPDALRVRTLALVREVGRPRGQSAVPSAVPSRRRGFSWPAAIAAVIAIALLAAGGLLAVRVNQQLHEQSEALAELNTATLRVSALPDATRVELLSPSDYAAAGSGTLLFSPATTELVISSPTLTEPPSGQRFACWLTRPDGTRARMGYMYFGGGLGYWTGWDDKLHDAGPGTTFGVTLVDANGRPVGGGDALVGTVSTD
jgi:hypothetical protein